MAKVLQADTGKKSRRCLRPRFDAVIYDPVRQLASFPARRCVLEIISVADPAHVAIVRARTDRAGDRGQEHSIRRVRRLYLMHPNGPGRNAWSGGRGLRFPGTYEVL